MWCRYGYRRIYHSRTRALERQEPDTEVRTATAADGAQSEYTRAGLVRGIFKSVASGVPLIQIEDELNVMGIPSRRVRRGGARSSAGWR